jgi:hypothetical protein
MCGVTPTAKGLLAQSQTQQREISAIEISDSKKKKRYEKKKKI